MSAVEELSLPAKEAVRSYLLRLIAVPVAILTVVSFLLGFAVNRWAFGDAYLAAFDQYADIVAENVAAIGAAKGSVDQLLQQVDGSNKSAAATVAQINSSRKLLTTSSRAR